jgi:class 3 adenylate cyclase
MPRFNPTRFPPGFFDLPPDAGRELPLDIIAAWTRSGQTPEVARELLAPCTLGGIMVSSDAAGLTRLSQERSLVEILAMVSRPKELVHAYGRAIGGIPVGIWAADNTLMFYPQGVAPDHVASMLLTVLDRVRLDCEAGIGLCAHRGVFYELGQGIYGPDADRVELIAEDFTEAGELVLTGEMAAALGTTASFTTAPRADLRARFGEVVRVTDGPRLAGIEASDFRYPLPFTDEFFGGLTEFQRTGRASLVPSPAYREAAVVVIEREREDRDVPEVAALNDLALSAAMKRLGRALVEDLAGLEIKTTASLSIYLFDEPRHGIDFCRKLRQLFAAEGVQLRIGMDVGRVLVFELGPGLRDIAGSPVNIASKLAEDLGEFGIIQLTAQAASEAGLTALPAARTVSAGGITVEAIRI